MDIKQAYLKVLKFSKQSCVSQEYNSDDKVNVFYQMFLMLFQWVSVWIQGPVSKTVWAAASCWINET